MKPNVIKMQLLLVLFIFWRKLIFFYNILSVCSCSVVMLLPVPLHLRLTLFFLHSCSISIIMPFVDLNKRFGINLDHWILVQSGPQPHQRAARCHAFEKEWIECAHGIGQTRAKKECKLEFEDFYECMHRQKTVSVEKAQNKIRAR